MSQLFLRRRRGLVFVAFVMVLGAAANANAAAYTILDLGALPGFMESRASGISASGQVVGDSSNSGTPGDGPQHAFRTDAGGSITAGSDLGTLGGGTSNGTAVNASGQAVGYSQTLGNAATHGFRTASNSPITTVSDLGTLGGTNSFAFGVNALGQAVGQSDITGNATYHAYRTAPNGPITTAGDLGTLGGSESIADGINAIGQVVGQSSISDGSYHAFRTVANGPITAAGDLGTLGGTNSFATAVNDSGQVIGAANFSGSQGWRAFRTAPNGPITSASDLGTLSGPDSYAYSINAAGQVVGSGEAANSRSHAFFVDITGAMQDLNNLIPTNSGWELLAGTGISDVGQITGDGLLNGFPHAFLLTPTSIPEPASLSLLALGCVGVLRRRRV